MLPEAFIICRRPLCFASWLIFPMLRRFAHLQCPRNGGFPSNRVGYADTFLETRGVISQRNEFSSKYVRPCSFCPFHM